MSARWIVGSGVTYYSGVAVTPRGKGDKYLKNDKGSDYRHYLTRALEEFCYD
jgi:hypothetical protein